MNGTLRYAAVCLITLGGMACGGSEPPARTPEPPPPPRSSVSPSEFSPSTVSPPPAATSPQAATPGTMSTPNSASLPSTQGAIGSGPPATVSEGATAPASLTDNQILFILQTANAGEIEQAKVAQQRAKNGRVKRFATMMVKDHGEADNKGREVARKNSITPIASEVSKNLDTTTRQMTGAMASQQGNDFDRSYIDAQVRAHQTVLELIDRQLLPSATSTEVKEMLKDLRPKIESHLKEAQEIQSGLAASSK